MASLLGQAEYLKKCGVYSVFVFLMATVFNIQGVEEYFLYTL